MQCSFENASRCKEEQKILIKLSLLQEIAVYKCDNINNNSIVSKLFSLHKMRASFLRKIIFVALKEVWQNRNFLPANTAIL